MANALQGLGVVKGDHVGVMAVNSSEYVTIYYACAKLGATFVPLNYRAKDEELTYMLNTAEVKVLFISDRYQELVTSDLVTELEYICSIVICAGDGAGRWAAGLPGPVGQSGGGEFVYTEDGRRRCVDHHLHLRHDGDAQGGRELSYGDLTVYVTNTMSPADPEAEAHDTTLLSVPLFHIAGRDGDDLIDLGWAHAGRCCRSSRRKPGWRPSIRQLA